ncbi:ABC transporter ATP-binding protein [Casimicrobium huifangae]|uniref:ABC transporter ATP-binding protein n=1 Tax=Casimicrobium huifangae TaxID=2591109 RepID=UPI0037850D70
MASLQLKNVVKDFGSAKVIRGVNLDVHDGEFVVFVGPSGCGKSTLLRMICGLEDITSGELFIDGTRANDIRAADRGLAMVFQSYALYPHMTVYQNMAFGLENIGTPKDQVKSKVDAAAKLLRLDALLERKPTQLSGGQRQRVAIGRSIVREPKIFLFDEPLSNLDAELRVSMRGEITGLHRRLGATMIYVTHDQVEAMTMADKIVVLRAGNIEQVGTPLDLYNWPDNKFVAGFIGSPQMNFVPVTAGHGDNIVTDHGATFAMRTESKPASGTALTLGVRPEHLTLEATQGAIALPMTVTGVEQLGGHSLLYGTLPGSKAGAEGPRITAQVAGQVSTKIGETATVYAAPDVCRLFATDGNEQAVR